MFKNNSKPNPLFGQINGPMPRGNVFTLMREFQNFKRNFKGNPQQTLQQMLNKGEITQDQLDEGIEAAKVVQNFLR